MKIPFPQSEIRGLSGGSDTWDDQSAGLILSDEYFGITKIETINDDFNDNSIDLAKWYTYLNAATVTETNQRIEIALTPNTIGAEGDLITLGDFTLRSSSVFVSFLQGATPGVDSLFIVQSAPGNRLMWLLTATTARAYVQNGYSTISSGSSIGITPGASLAFRIREILGTVYFDYSIDAGATWTTSHTEKVSNIPWEIGDISALVAAYEFSGTGATVQNKSIFDNFNVSAAATTVNDSRPAELSGSAQSNSNRPAELSGSISVNDARSAELSGSAAANAQRPAEMHGQASSNDVRSAELTGAITSTDQRPAEINASAPAADVRPAELRGQDSASSNRPSEMNGVAGAADARSSELSGVDSAFSLRSAELHGSQSVNSNRPSELTGADSATSQRSSEMHGSAVASSVRPAELSGKADLSSNRSAEISGADSAVSARAAEMEGEIVGATVNSSRAAEMHGSAVGVDTRPSEISGSDSAVTSRPAEIGGAASVSDSRPGEMEGVNPPAVSSRSAEMNTAPRPQDIRGTFTATPKAGTTTLVRENQSIDLTRVGEGAPVTHKGGSYGLTRKGDII